jgi:flotillin
MDTLVIIGAVFAVVAVSLLVIVNRLIEICPPNEVLIFAGTHRPVEEGDDRVVGYRLVQGGRGIRIPLLETVDKMNLTNMIIDLRVTGAYSKGGIPLNVEGVANVKISSKKKQLANAIERFLGRSRQEIMVVAKDTLEGNLRGVLATLTPEEVNRDREKFAANLLHEADHDLARLGLELDTLKIQHVTDDKGYLDSLGRRQSAEMLKGARIAEAENAAVSSERSAANIETAEIARVTAEIATARAEAQRRIVDAMTRRDAVISEQRAVVLGLVAKAQAELAVQRARLDQVRLQLIADKVKPAEARKQQMIEAARGQASRIIEDGRANAEAIRQMSETWQTTGDSARQIIVAQKLTSLVSSLMSTVGEIPVDKVTFIDSGLTRGGSNFAVNAAVTSEQLKHTLGLDVPGLIKSMAAGRSEPPRAVAPPAPPAPPPRRRQEEG